jgi:hypothetical protein
VSTSHLSLDFPDQRVWGTNQPGLGVAKAEILAT